MTSRLARALTVALLGLSGVAHAFPDRPITLVVPFPAGGTTDIIGRLIAHGMSTRLKQPVVVDNRAGAGGAVGAAFVAKAPANGYTLLVSSNTTFTVNPALRENLPYDPVQGFEGFEGVGVVGETPLVILAHSAFPARSLPELVALARKKPGQLSYGSFGAGTVSHLAGEMFKLTAGIDLLHVPYKGSAPAMADLLGGHVALTVDTPVAALPQMRSGKVRALAVTSPRAPRRLQRCLPSPNPATPASSSRPGWQWWHRVACRNLRARCSARRWPKHWPTLW